MTLNNTDNKKDNLLNSTTQCIIESSNSETSEDLPSCQMFTQEVLARMNNSSNKASFLKDPGFNPLQKGFAKKAQYTSNVQCINTKLPDDIEINNPSDFSPSGRIR